MEPKLKQLLSQVYLANTLVKESNTLLNRAYTDYMSYRAKLDNYDVKEDEYKALKKVLEAVENLETLDFSKLENSELRMITKCTEALADYRATLIESIGVNNND